MTRFMAIIHPLVFQGQSALSRRYRHTSNLPSGCIAALCMDEVAEPLAYREPAGLGDYPKGSGDATLGAPAEKLPLPAKTTTQIEGHR